MPTANLNQDIGPAEDNEPSKGCTAHFRDCEAAVLRELQHAEKVCICVAWIKNVRILDTLKRLQVPTRLCITGDALLRRPNIHGLVTWNGDSFPARMLGPIRGGRRRPLMHSKFMVVWRGGKPRVVLTGSYNYTNHANLNVENIVRIENRVMAAQYASEAQRIWAKSRRWIKAPPPARGKKRKR